ncbi:hypothetical protein [Streptomyces erythrochromogenes]|uniref:hypothetical protein n=1 Tax=Streptomyces erythrochromogenes TaxID=285574 RepID=UPI0038000148
MPCPCTGLIEHGVRGGITERERRALLKRLALVTSWRALLVAARSEHERRARGRQKDAGTATRLSEA